MNAHTNENRLDFTISTLINIIKDKEIKSQYKVFTH